MTKEGNFIQIFIKHKKIIEEFESQMDLKINTKDQYSLDTFKINPINNKKAFFASTINIKNI